VSQIALVILPVFLLIFLGWALRRRSFPGEGFWAPAERLTYFVFFPVLLASTLARADFSDLAVLPMAGAIVAAILLMTGALLLARPWLGLSGPGFTSLYQGVVRMNTYIGLAVSFGVAGEAGLAAAAVAVAAIVPLVNLLCVSMLAHFGTATQPTVAGVAKQVATNPLILGCALGGALNASGLGLPPVLGETMQILARAALPLGLLCVGAALDLHAARAAKRPVLVSSLLKLAVLPALTWAGCQLLGVGGTAAFVAVLFNGLPTATSAYILARQMGGDATLMASLITAQTLLAMLTLPLILAPLAP
jgi:predicted permease